eukprot:3615376-Amphidinium_carterae.1
MFSKVTSSRCGELTPPKPRFMEKGHDSTSRVELDFSNGRRLSGIAIFWAPTVRTRVRGTIVV